MGSLLGGHRFVYDEQDDDSKLPCLHRLYQLLISALVPISVKASIMLAISVEDENSRWLACAVAGGVPAVLNLIIMANNLRLSKQKSKENEEWNETTL